MRKKLLVLVPLCLLAAAVWAAAAGDAGDPLASLSYLNGAFTNKVDAAVDARLENSGALSGGDGGISSAPIGAAAAWTERRVKQEDVLVRLLPATACCFWREAGRSAILPERWWM